MVIMYSTDLVLIFAVLNALTAQETPCITPYNENGTCIPLVDCSILFNEFASSNKYIVGFIKDSYCSPNPKEKKVCCGSTGTPSVITDDNGDELLNILYTGSQYLPDKSICGLDENVYRLTGDVLYKYMRFPWTALLEYQRIDTAVNRKSATAANEQETATQSQRKSRLEKKEEGITKEKLETTTEEDKKYVTTTEKLITINTAKPRDNPHCKINDDDDEGCKHASNSKVQRESKIETDENVGQEKQEEPIIRCAATLISEKYLVTAAQCVNNANYKLVSVRLGELNLSRDPDCVRSDIKADHKKWVCASKYRTVKVANYIAHPDRNVDLALISLEDKVTPEGFVRPICLPPAKLRLSPKKSSMFTSGWPKLKDGTLPNNKQTSEMKYLGHCEKHLHQAKGFRNSMNKLCLENDIEKPCGGDTGGGVVRLYKDRVFKEQQWYLEGVLSWNEQCHDSKNPVVYQRVPDFTPWILSAMNDHEFRGSFY